MKKVLLRAPLLSYSGYGVHSRQVFKWLLTRKDLDVRTHILDWGNTTWMINPDYESGLVGEIMSRSGGPTDEKFDITFQLQLPDEWEPSLGKYNFGLSAWVETDRCNPEWIQKAKEMDSIIVPTNHVKKTILNTGSIDSKIHVVPESYIDQISNVRLEPLELDIDTDFNFLIVSQLTGSDSNTDRKNLFNTIKYLCDSFKNDPTVGIILKTNSGRGTRIDRKLTYNTFQNLINQVRKGQFPKFHILHGNMSSDEIAGLYKNKSVKCLINLTRGEGFGLPILEAAASGLPVMATGWSGHMDFMGMGKFIPINYRLVDIHESRVDGRIFTAGMRWAEPNENDFKNKVEKFRKKSEIPGQWAKDLSEKVLETHSQSAINKLYDEVLNQELGL